MLLGARFLLGEWGRHGAVDGILIHTNLVSTWIFAEIVGGNILMYVVFSCFLLDSLYNNK